MNLWARILFLLRIKTGTTLDRAEDPLEVMTYVHGQQQELLHKVRQGLVEVAVSKRRLEMQVEKLQTRVPQIEEQARRALGLGREDLARIALQRKQTAVRELAGLERQAADVGEEERKLAFAEQQVSARIEELRVRREALSARYTAAEAQVRVNEALSGLSGDTADLGAALARAEEKVELMQARASALDALVGSDLLALPPATSDVVERELNELASRDAVDDELAALKAELQGYEWDTHGPRYAK